MSYPDDLSDKQWQKIGRFFERPDPRGARSKYPKRRVVEAVLYRLREGCRWRALPHDFPPWDTVYDHWRRWQKRGVWPQVLAVLGTRWREGTLGRARRAPRHAILDSQTVKTAAAGEERGLHGGKKVKGGRGQPRHALGRAGVRGQQSGRCRSRHGNAASGRTASFPAKLHGRPRLQTSG